MYIKVNNLKESAHAQLALFQAGYQWMSGDRDLLLGCGYDRFPMYLSTNKGERTFGRRSAKPENDTECVICYEPPRFQYGIKKAHTAWTFGVKDKEIVARDANNYEYVVARLVDANGHRVACAEARLLREGYDTSGYQWDLEGHIIFK